MYTEAKQNGLSEVYLTHRYADVTIIIRDHEFVRGINEREGVEGVQYSHMMFQKTIFLRGNSFKSKHC